MTNKCRCVAYGGLPFADMPALRRPKSPTLTGILAPVRRQTLVI
jgi:hypothetical protein